jgi:hypothetical protein
MGEKEKIIDFLYLSDHWIHRIIDERVFLFILPRRRRLLPLAQEAYESVQAKLESVVDYVRHLNENEFIYNLEQCGLTGIEWDFKYAICMQHADALEKRLDKTIFQATEKITEDVYGQRRTIRRYVKRLLKSIDSILDSIIGAGVPIHPLKEIKEAILSLID